MNVWNDQLTSYGGVSITYDSIGNPLTYGTYTYTWTNGRQLESIYQVSPYVNTTFKYNDEGIRTKKIYNGIKHEYSVSGGQINREVVYSRDGQYVTHDLRYYYDAAGNSAAIRAFTRTSSTAEFTDNIYYLLTNMQGDVIAIYNQDGQRIYEYAYDAWGMTTVSVLSSASATDKLVASTYNPFRYRGYYYDADLGMYDLGSRYYNQEWGRFLNADMAVSNIGGDLRGYNLFAYCFNDPVNHSDSKGDWPKWATKLVIGTVCAVAAVAITAATAGTGAAAVVPALLAVGKTVAVSTAVGAGVGAVGHRLETGSWEGSGEAALEGAVDGYMWGGIGAACSSTINALQTMGKLPKRVRISKLVDNPNDPYKTIGPKQGAVRDKIDQIKRLGKYDYPSVQSIGHGLYEIQNGHHTVQAMRSLNRKTIKVWLVK